MKDKLIAVTTLGFIFSLFFYYKVISPVDNATASSKIDEIDPVAHIVNQVEKAENLNEITVPITDSFKSDENDNTNCKLDIDETNQLSFSEAFKYFRHCNGVDSNFNWNKNIYSTLLKSEIESKGHYWSNTTLNFADGAVFKPEYRNCRIFSFYLFVTR